MAFFVRLRRTSGPPCFLNSGISFKDLIKVTDVAFCATFFQRFRKISGWVLTENSIRPEKVCNVILIFSFNVLIDQIFKMVSSILKDT